MNISYELLAYRGAQAKRMNSQMQVTGLETPLHPTKIKIKIIKKNRKINAFATEYKKKIF